MHYQPAKWKWHSRLGEVERFFDRKEIPATLKSKREWAFIGRTVPPKTVPAAILGRWGSLDELAPEDDPIFVTEHLTQTQFYYSREQTEDFKSPFVKAYHQFIGLFCRHAYRKDFIYKWDGDPVSPGWPHANYPLGDSIIKRHVRHKQIAGIIGDHYTRHLAFDLDFHASDVRREFFLARCKVFYKEMGNWFTAWFAECKIDQIGGIHFYGLTAKLHISRAQALARKFLTHLDKTYPELAAIESFTKIEVYPVERKGGGGKGLRLPLCKGRVTITDQLLQGEPDANCINLVQWLLRQDRDHLPLEAFMDFVAGRTPEHSHVAPLARAKKPDRKKAAGQGMGSVGTVKGQFYRKLIDFWTGRLVPEPDTIGIYVVMTLRALKFEGVDEEEAVDLLEKWLLDLKDTSFSDRLTNDFEELMRVTRLDAKAVWLNNGYQPRVEESDRKLRASVDFYNRRGVRLRDPATWDNIYRLVPASVDFSEYRDFRFGFQERQLLKQELHPILKSKELNTETKDTYEVARRIVLFAKKYPHRELAGAYLPHLCAGLKVHWHKNKSHQVLLILTLLGFICKTHKKVWRGQLKQFNRASRYMVGEALRPYYSNPSIANEDSHLDLLFNPIMVQGGWGSVSIISHSEVKDNAYELGFSTPSCSAHKVDTS